MTFRLVDCLNRVVKRTEVHFIALKAVIELGEVDLEHSPVLCERMFTDAGGDGWGAEDMAEDAVVGFVPVCSSPY